MPSPRVTYIVIYILQLRCRAIHRKTQVVRVLLGMVRFSVQRDDVHVFLDLASKCIAHTSYRMIDDMIDEERDIRDEFVDPLRIWTLIDGLPQDVGFSDAFEKSIIVFAVGNENGFVQVTTATVTRGIIVLESPIFLRTNP